MSEITTIFISAYRNFAIRYILHSDIFRELKIKKNLRLVIFVKDDAVAYYKDMFKGDNVIVEPVLYNEAMKTLRTGRVAHILTHARAFTSGSVPGTKNDSHKVFHTVFGRDYGDNLGMKVIYAIISFLSYFGNRFKLFRTILRQLESAIFPGDMYDHYFEKYKPTALIVSSVGYMIDPFIMRSAKKHGCKVVSIVHSWDNPSTKGYRGADPDCVIAWNDIMKRDLNAFQDIPNEDIHIGGIAHWDFYFNGDQRKRSKEEFIGHFGLAPDRKIIFYGTSSPNLFPDTFDVIEKLLKDIKLNVFSLKSQLLVRLHPLYLIKIKGGAQVMDKYRDKMENIESEYNGLVRFNLPKQIPVGDDVDMPVEDMYDLADMLRHSDLLLTEYSTLIIEAAIVDLPIINVGISNYRGMGKEKAYIYTESLTHIKRVLQPGATREAHSYKELLEYIELYLKTPFANREERKKLVEQEITHNPGCAGKKIAEYIYERIEALDI